MLSRQLKHLKTRSGFLKLSENTDEFHDEFHHEFHDEYQYIHLIKDILKYGEMVEGRNGFTKTVIGGTMHFSLADNKMPLLTTKVIIQKKQHRMVPPFSKLLIFFY